MNSGRTIALDGWGAEALASWRSAARALLAAEVAPERVRWHEAAPGGAGDAALALDLALDASPDGSADPAADSLPDRPSAAADAAAADAPAAASPPRVPRRFLELAEVVACHADPARWALLYRTLWRLTHGAPRLMDDHADADVARLARLERAVRREVHKCHAFVRFRRVDDAGGTDDAPDARDAPDAGSTADPTHAPPAYVAWFEPEHDVLARAAPLFARRFPHMRWAIVGPRRSVRWDGSALVVGPGVGRDAAPPDDAHESLWRTYYAHVFNPARVKLRAMRNEMPERYWHNLPEAALIPALVREAPARVAAMLERARADEARREEERGGARDAARHVAGDTARDGAGDVARDGGNDIATALPPAAADASPVVGSARSAAAAHGGVAADAVGRAAGVRTGTSGPLGPRDASAVGAAGAAPGAAVHEITITEHAFPTAHLATRWLAWAAPGATLHVRAPALLAGHAVAPHRLPQALRTLLPPALAGANHVAASAVPAAVRDAAWARLHEALALLAASGRLGALVLRLPASVAPTRQGAAHVRELAARLAAWPSAAGGPPRGVVEFAHPGWLAPALRARTLAFLPRHALGLALPADAPEDVLDDVVARVGAERPAPDDVSDAHTFVPPLLLVRAASHAAAAATARVVEGAREHGEVHVLVEAPVARPEESVLAPVGAAREVIGGGGAVDGG